MSERWNGSVWSLVPMAAPAGLNRRVSVAGVACWSASGCVAVGSGYTTTGTQTPFAETWNGSSWSPNSVPVPDGARAAELLGVSCSSATACTAAGDAHVGKVQETLVERWNGTSWVVQSSPNPPKDAPASLTGVACATATVCMAVGNDHYGSSYQMIAESWNGGAWTLVTLPFPSDAQFRPSYGNVYGISCPSAAACVAGGDFRSTTGLVVPLVERWNGTRWNASSPGIRTGESSGSQLNAISCLSATTCSAVGQDDGGGLAYTLASGLWEVQALPGSPLSGVACSSAASCDAVGAYFQPGALDGAAAASSSNGTFTRDTVPSPTGVAIAGLEAISCPTSRACTAVGQADVGQGPGLARSTAEHWDGSTWSFQSTPTVPNAFTNPQAVSCPTASVCIAIGQADSSQVTLWSATSNGSTWTSQTIPTPSEGLYFLFQSISCPSATWCEAAGTYYDSNNVQHPLLYHWNGTSWTSEPASLPPGQAGGGLIAVSCPSTSACVAVGTAETSSGATEWYSDHYNGASWTIDTMPQPPNDPNAILLNVSCATSASCMAVGGTDLNDALYGPPVAEAWNGSNWTVTTPTNPDNASGLFVSVSCPSTTTCLAVGEQGPSGTNNEPLAESWNGSAWSTQDILVPRPGTVVVAISCSSTTACRVTGGTSYENIEPDVSLELPLIETFSG